MNTNPIKSWAQSSTDPTQLSLSVTSAAKVIIGIIGTLAAYRGIDSVTITTQLQAIVDIGVTLIPAGFTAYHSLQLLYGLTRKLFVKAPTQSPI
jgi:phage shock protein PspC (stress-responsive transcriptional regulator)